MERLEEAIRQPATDYDEIYLKKAVYDQMERLPNMTDIQKEALEHNTDVNIFLEPITRRLVVQLCTGIYKRTHETSFRWPATWWDHVKLELLPEWLSKRLKPCQYTIKTVVAAQVFPEVKSHNNYCTITQTKDNSN